MNTKYINDNFFRLIVFILFYFSLILGFYYDENLNFGAESDWTNTDLPPIKDFSNNFIDTLLSYDKYNHRHSPIYLIFLSLLYKFGFAPDIIRLIHLNISLLIIYFFYKCLTLKFKSIDKNILFLISLSIFLSPTFRSISIWPSTRSLGLIFFLLSVYEFIKYQNFGYKKYIWKNIIFLIISSYISPNFSLFILFFYFFYFKKLNLSYFFLICFIAFIFSIPALYYLFYLDINFLLAQTPGITDKETISLSFNFSNKIMIISSIIFFQLIPFLFNKKFLDDFLNFSKNNFISLIIFTIINIYFFDYVMSYTGGGFFFQISNYIFKNNSIFYLFCYLSLLLVWYFSKNNFDNLLIFIILITSNIQNTIYHKYYDPLVMILFFTIIKNNLNITFLERKLNLIYLYLFYLIFIVMRLVKNFIYINF